MKRPLIDEFDRGHLKDDTSYGQKLKFYLAWKRFVRELGRAFLLYNRKIY